MSWNGSGKCTIGALYEKSFPFAVNPQEGYGEGESRMAIAAAWNALIELADVLGPEDAEVSVSLSGHANPGNEPEEGWSKDFISISIYRV